MSGWVLRDDVTEFVFNGYTHHEVPIVHKPTCHHVKEAFPPYVEEPLLEVIQRFPQTGVITHNVVRRLDLLAALFAHAHGYETRGPHQPVDQVGFCEHCMIQRAEAVA